MIAVEFFHPENGSHVTMRFVMRVNARIVTQTNKEEGGPGIQVWVRGPLQCTGKFRRGKERAKDASCYHLMSLFVQMKSPKRTHWALNPVCADLQWLIMLILFRKGAELTRLSRHIYKLCFDFIYLSTCWITFLLINIHFPPPSSQFHTGSTNSTDSTSTTTVKYVETTTTGDPKPSRGTLQYVVNFLSFITRCCFALLKAVVLDQRDSFVVSH